MTLKTVRIRNIRNIAEAELSPGPGINIIAGPNGSGKTSLLEAIFILGRGRSFRDNKARSIITKGAESLEVFGISEHDAISARLGIRKSKSDTLARLNGEKIRKLSILARELPLYVITPRSHEILESGSAHRRRFIEWGVFHVEHGYQSISMRYQRALAQRNAALKHQAGDHALWDRELDGLADVINGYRQSYLKALIEYFRVDLQALLPSVDVSIAWHKGWDSESGLIEALEKNRSSDLRRGFTQVGPHRADFSVQLEGTPAKNWASRGQQKLIITALFLAQARLIRDRIGRYPVLLIDDLAAELDTQRRELLLDRMTENGGQVFVTSTDAGIFCDVPNSDMFHVEHGVLGT